MAEQDLGNLPAKPARWELKQKITEAFMMVFDARDLVEACRAKASDHPDLDYELYEAWRNLDDATSNLSYAIDVIDEALVAYHIPYDAPVRQISTGREGRYRWGSIDALDQERHYIYYTDTKRLSEPLAPDDIEVLSP
jgi:hypothetical protein